MSKVIHNRQKIRESVVSILITEKVNDGRILSGYTTPPQVEELPLVLVYNQSEAIEELNQAPRELRRNLFLTVEIISSASTEKELQDDLDDISYQVEEALSRDDSLGCTVDDIILNSTEFQLEGETNESPVGAVRLGYLIKYRTFAPSIQYDVDDHNSSEIQYDIAGNEIDDPSDVLDHT